MTGYRILYHHRIRADDGQAVHVRELIRALRGEGHDVLECALVPKAEEPTPQASASSGGGIWQKLSLPRTAVECLEIAYGRQGARMLQKAAAEFQPHFIYERHALHCDSGLRAARALDVPLLLEVNSPLVDEMAKLGSLKFAGTARRTERRVLAGADLVFAVTDVLRNMLVELGARPERTVVTPNGAIPSRFGPEVHEQGRLHRERLGIPESAFVLGFVGYMRPWHRLDLAVELLRRDHLQDVHLVLVGEGPAMPDVEAAAREGGVESRVHTVGAVSGAAVPAWTCSFDAALIPAINEYASPLKLFDYLAAGVPTLAPRQPNLEETIEDSVNGLLFEKDDGASLEARVSELVANREAARAIGENGLQSLLREDWTWPGNARRVVRAYEEIAAPVESRA